MRRFALFVVVILVGLGGYFWYHGDAQKWLSSLKEAVGVKDRANPAPAPAQVDDARPVPAVAALPYREALSALQASGSEDRVEAWTELTEAFVKNLPGARDKIPTEIDRFVETYVLSRRLPDDVKVAARVNVDAGDSLRSIAKRLGTTPEAIKRLNNISGDLIRPGLTLKVLNQPVAVHIDKSEFLLWVTYGGRLLFVRPCGIGKENRTPAGRFEISERIVNPDWYPPEGSSVPFGDPRNELGSRWMGFKDTAEYRGLGIHEARRRDDVGKASSNGCIRLVKEDVELLFDVVPEGTAVEIVE